MEWFWMTKQFRSVMTALAMAVSAMSAHAGLIDITFSGVADFQIGEQILEDAAFTVRTTADTAKVFLTSPPFSDIEVLQYDELVGLLTIDGLGSGSFTKTIAVFSNPADEVAGLMAHAQVNPFAQVFEIVDLLDVKSPQLASYDLKSDIVLNDAAFYDPQQWYQVETSFGKVTASGFEAVKMQVAASTVPEPSTALFFALGSAMLIGAATMRVRRI
jgi:hypothetical protein